MNRKIAIDRKVLIKEDSRQKNLAFRFFCPAEKSYNLFSDGMRYLMVIN